MGKTSIEWTDARWNPLVGCSEVSPGCANCYAARLAATRLREIPTYKGLAIGKIERIPGEKGSSRFQRGAIRWTGEIRCLPGRLGEPQGWRKPRRIFVCDMGDLFHENTPHEFLLQIFRAMADAPQHTYQILTKRADRMMAFLKAFAHVEQFHPMREDCVWPWPNVWCGVSVENQHFADERIPLLLDTPAAIRFISAEPLLGPVLLTGNLSSDGARPEGIRTNFLTGQWFDHTGYEQTKNDTNPHGFPRLKIDWVICGGESGPNARPMHPDWARGLRDQCQAAGVPFFFKQWGKHCPWADIGRELDGRTWDEFPPAVKP